MSQGSNPFIYKFADYRLAFTLLRSRSLKSVKTSKNKLKKSKCSLFCSVLPNIKLKDSLNERFWISGWQKECLMKQIKGGNALTL